MSEMEQMKRRIAALEARLSAEGEKVEEKVEEKKEDDGKETLASEIAALEKILGSDEEVDEDDENDEKDEKDEKEVEAKSTKASEVDPSGVEEEITQKRFTEVEGLTHGEELATGTSVGAVAPTRSEYVARMKKASERLDRVAEYLEGHGRREMAFRIDRIADAVDAKINGGK